MHWSTFDTLANLLLVEVNILVSQALLLDLLNRVLDILQIEWIGIRKKDSIGGLHVVPQRIFKHDSEFVLLINKFYFGWDPLPILFVKGFLARYEILVVLLRDL